MNFDILDIESEINKYFDDIIKHEKSYNKYVQLKIYNYFNSIKEELHYRYSIFLEKQGLKIEDIIKEEENKKSQIEIIKFDFNPSYEKKENIDIKDIEDKFYKNLVIKDEYYKISSSNFQTRESEEEKKYLNNIFNKNLKIILSKIDILEIDKNYKIQLEKIVKNTKDESKVLNKQFKSLIKDINNDTNNKYSKIELENFIRESRKYIVSIINIYKNTYGNENIELDSKIDQNLFLYEQYESLDQIEDINACDIGFDEIKETKKNKIINIKLELQDGSCRSIPWKDFQRKLDYNLNRKLRNILKEYINEI